MAKNESGGWDWSAFFLGPFWYLSNGMPAKGIFLLAISIVTFFCAIPFIWIYCGAKGKGDLYEFRLKQKNRFDIDKL